MILSTGARRTKSGRTSRKVVMKLDERVTVPGKGAYTLRALHAAGLVTPREDKGFYDAGYGKQIPDRYWLLLRGTTDGWRITRVAYLSLTGTLTLNAPKVEVVRRFDPSYKSAWRIPADNEKPSDMSWREFKYQRAIKTAWNEFQAGDYCEPEDDGEVDPAGARYEAAVAEIEAMYAPIEEAE